MRRHWLRECVAEIGDSFFTDDNRLSLRLDIMSVGHKSGELWLRLDINSMDTEARFYARQGLARLVRGLEIAAPIIDDSAQLHGIPFLLILHLVSVNMDDDLDYYDPNLWSWDCLPLSKADGANSALRGGARHEKRRMDRGD
ncbi:MAG: hypothetical protein WBX25_11420 [Rhodomicrobium sp.]